MCCSQPTLLLHSCIQTASQLARLHWRNAGCALLTNPTLLPSYAHRLARLRWRNAFAVLGTWSQQSIIQSGLTRADHGKLLPKVRILPG